MPISPETHEQYAARYEQLRRQTAKALGVSQEAPVAPIQIVEHLVGRKSELAKRTWRFYKAALVHQIQLAIARSTNTSAQEEAEHALRRLRSEPQTGAMTRGTRTSALKAKHLSQKDFDTLMAYITSNIDRHVRGRALLVWCRASIPTGLRPIEWRSAYRERLPDGRPVLVVPNAKATNGRGNGKSRILDLSDCTADQLDAIDELLELVEGYRSDDGLLEFQRRIKDYLYRAARSSLSKRIKYPSLYTFRHMFAAAAKSQFGEAEVAALMGQASDATASRNYARAQFASGTISVKPIDVQVASVRRKAKPAPGATAKPSRC